MVHEAPTVGPVPGQDLGDGVTDKLAYAQLAEEATALPGVQRVRDQRTILGKLFTLLDGLRYLALAFAVLRNLPALGWLGSSA